MLPDGWTKRDDYPLHVFDEHGVAWLVAAETEGDRRPCFVTFDPFGETARQRIYENGKLVSEKTFTAVKPTFYFDKDPRVVFQKAKP